MSGRCRPGKDKKWCRSSPVIEFEVKIAHITSFLFASSCSQAPQTPLLVLLSSLRTTFSSSSTPIFSFPHRLANPRLPIFLPRPALAPFAAGFICATAAAARGVVVSGWLRGMSSPDSYDVSSSCHLKSEALLGVGDAVVRMARGSQQDFRQPCRPPSRQAYCRG